MPSSILSVRAVERQGPLVRRHRVGVPPEVPRKGRDRAKQPRRADSHRSPHQWSPPRRLLRVEDAKASEARRGHRPSPHEPTQRHASPALATDQRERRQEDQGSFHRRSPVRGHARLRHALAQFAGDRVTPPHRRDDRPAPRNARALRWLCGLARPFGRRLRDRGDGSAGRVASRTVPICRGRRGLRTQLQRARSPRIALGTDHPRHRSCRLCAFGDHLSGRASDACRHMRSNGLGVLDPCSGAFGSGSLGPGGRARARAKTRKFGPNLAPGPLIICGACHQLLR